LVSEDDLSRDNKTLTSEVESRNLILTFSFLRVKVKCVLNFK